MDAGATRVAVHGTIFSVAWRRTRSSSTSSAAPSRSAPQAASEPPGQPPRGAPPRGLLARWRQVLALLALSLVLILPHGRPRGSAERGAARRGPRRTLRGVEALSDAPPAEADPAAPPRPPAPVRAAALDEPAVRVALDGCFESSYAGVSPGVRLSVVSTLQLTLRADGSIEALRFSPPLEPSFQSCASSILTQTSPGQASFSISAPPSRVRRALAQQLGQGVGVARSHHPKLHTHALGIHASARPTSRWSPPRGPGAG